MAVAYSIWQRELSISPRHPMNWRSHLRTLSISLLLKK